MNRYAVMVVVVALVFLAGRDSRAEQAYVSDSFEITFRTGPSLENKVIATLDSGEPVEVLETRENWSRVRSLAEDGPEESGWVLSRYLITREPWEKKARGLMEANVRLTENLERVNNREKEAARQVEALTERLKAVTASLEEVQASYDQLKQEAGGYLELKQKFSAVRGELESARKEIDRLSAENQRLKSSEKRKWFAMGALVLLAGLLIGVLVGRRQRRRKLSYY